MALGTGDSGYKDLGKFGCGSRVLVISSIAICYMQLSVCMECVTKH